MKTARFTDSLFEKFYSPDRGFGDATRRFHKLCSTYVPRGGSILEIGAGATNETSSFLSTIGPLRAVDVSDEVMTNSAVVAGKVYEGDTLPYDDLEFDGCVSNYVLEHLANPECHFAEVDRVLKRGGVYVVRTPNLLHYVASMSRLMPHRIHVAIANGLRALPEDSHDPWPTLYRANRPPVLRRLAAAAGLSIERCEMIECEPSYARGSSALFFPMMLYERLVNSSEAFAPFRASINAVFRKP